MRPIILISAFSLATSALAQTPDPFVTLFDTKSSLPSNITENTGWVAVPEDELRTAFAGDVVMQNDKLRLVLRKNAASVEVFAATGTRWIRRASLQPRASNKQKPLHLDSVKTVENTRGAVLLDCRYADTSFLLRLPAGDLTLEVRPGTGLSQFVLECQPAFVVVPDLLSSDRVFTPNTFNGDNLLLPSESQCLHLTGNGSALVLCLWKRGTYRAEARLRSGSTHLSPQTSGSLWLAVFEQENIWRECLTGSGTKLDARLPFPAKWRGNLVTTPDAPTSVDFQDDPSADLSISRVDDTGAPIVGTSEPPLQAGSSLVIYPIDRSRRTPMTVFTPVDVMRNVLGVGPCQFILDAEGGASATESATPQQVALWTEKQWKKNKLKKEELQPRLVQMIAQMKTCQNRLEQYRNATARIAEAGKTNNIAQTARRMAAELQSSPSPDVAASLGEKLLASNAVEIPALIKQLNAIGVAQEKLLARSRFTMLWIRQQATMAAETNTDDYSKQVLKETDVFFTARK